MSELTDDDTALLRQFRALVRQAVPDPLFTVARAAEALGLSERSLYRRFRELTGQTPYASLREHRLARAHELLQAGSVHSIREVACAVGIKDVAYFARIFYQRFQVRAADLLRP